MGTESLVLSSQNTTTKLAHITGSYPITTYLPIAVTKPQQGSWENFEYFYWTRLSVYCVLNEMISLLGIVSNVLNVCIFSMEGQQVSSNLTLMHLSVVDLLTSIAGLFSCLQCVITELESVEKVLIVGFLQVNVWTILAILYTVTCLLSLQMSVERCLAVWFPFSIGRFITPVVTARLNQISWAFSVIVLFPSFIGPALELKAGLDSGNEPFSEKEASNITIISARLNSTFLETLFVQNALDQELMSFYEWYKAMFTDFFLAFRLICSFMCALATIGIAVGLKWHERSMQNSMGGSERMSTSQKRSAKIALCVGVIFLISATPNIMLISIYLMYPGNIRIHHADLRSHVYLILLYASFTTLSLTCTLNFFVYFKFNTKFSQACTNLFCFQKKVN